MFSICTKCSCVTHLHTLSLQAGCDEIWEKICSVQGKDPSVDFTQVLQASECFDMRQHYLPVWQDLVEDSEDDRGFDEISETAPPIELPAAELARLEVLSIFWPTSP